MQNRIACQLGKSNYLLGFFLISHLGAMIGIISADWPLIFRTALIITIIAHCYWAVRYYAYRVSERSVVTVWVDEQNRWGFQTKGGKQYIGTLLADSIRTGFLLILRFKCRARIENIIIPLDAMADHNYRRLSGRLYIEKTQKR